MVTLSCLARRLRAVAYQGRRRANNSGPVPVQMSVPCRRMNALILRIARTSDGVADM